MCEDLDPFGDIISHNKRTPLLFQFKKHNNETGMNVVGDGEGCFWGFFFYKKKRDRGTRGLTKTKKKSDFFLN